MEIRQLQYFVAIADSGGFSRAARVLGVSQPTLSQQVSRLEGSLGVSLFDRLARGVVLTEAGRAFLPRAKRITREVHDAQTMLASDVQRGTGPLAVGAIPTMAPFVLPPVLERFKAEFPECELTVREDFTDRLVESLVDHELDLAILSTPIDHPAIDLDVIATERLLVASSASGAWASDDEASLADLRGEPAVVIHEVHCLGQQIQSFCSLRRLSQRIVCRGAQLATVLEMVRLGMGISLVPEMCARQDTSPERIYRPFKRGGPKRDIAIARRKGRERSILADRFAALVEDETKTMLA